MPRRAPKESIEVVKAREELARKNQLNDLKQLLVDPRMRAFLWRFMAWCQPFGEQFNPNFGVAAHNLGRRAAAMWLWSEITEADFEALVQMQIEARIQQAESDAAAANPPSPDPED